MSDSEPKSFGPGEMILNYEPVRPHVDEDPRPLTRQERAGYGRPPRLVWETFKGICHEVQRTGALTSSCASMGFTYGAVKELLKRANEDGDDRWQSYWDQSLALYIEDVEMEAVRRARFGTNKPVFYRGQEVGFVKEYSDQLMMMLLKALNPSKYRENLKIEADVKTGVLVVPERSSVDDFLKEIEDKDDADKA